MGLLISLLFVMLRMMMMLVRYTIIAMVMLFQLMTSLLVGAARAGKGSRRRRVRF